MELKIEKDLYETILQDHENLQQETGGYIGIHNHQIIQYTFDSGIGIASLGRFTPNPEIFHKKMEDWLENDAIQEFGILHRHVNGQVDLSNGDFRYIDSLFSRNDWLQGMYFPVVLPKETMAVYWARRKGRRVEIEDVKLLVQK